MNVTHTPLDGVKVFHPHRSELGNGEENVDYFVKSCYYRMDFVYEQIQRTSCGALKGLYYEIEEPCYKIITPISGTLFGVAVDIRDCYGPNANIRTYAVAEFYGAVSGHEFTLFNGGRLHYDRALSGLIGYDTGFGIDRLWEKSDFVVAAGP